jgi:hypothetical protein
VTEYKIHTKVLEHGQARPYANHVDKTEVTVLRKLIHEDEFIPEESESMVKQFALQLCACIPFGTETKMYPWKKFKKWHERYIDSVEITGPGVAVVTLIKPYID